MHRKSFAIFIVFLLLLATAAHGEPDDFIEITTTSGAPLRLHRFAHDELDIEIDGHIREPEWLRTEPFRELRVIEPDTLAKPPYATDVRILYTERGIYVSVDMEQPAATIVERYAPRDSFNVRRDHTGFTLDTSGEGRYGYWINVSLGGTQMDGTVLPERDYGSDWDGAWYGASQRTERGWSAEFYLPWSQVAMPKQSGTRKIGFYLSRTVAHLDERWGFPALPSSQPKFMSILPKIELDGVDLRQQWSVFPYASGTYDRVVDDPRFKAGADLFWRPSTNLQLTATLNPDFGSVESDDVVVNFTADEVFFPEKRLFFLEGQEVFNTLERTERRGVEPVTAVNTRRIGGRPRDPQLPDGVELPDREALKPADLIAAVKATGQFGPVRYGILTATEDDTDYLADDGLPYVQDGRDFGVLRFIYEDSIGAAYRGLGWISTIVTHPESDAVVHGADLHYLTSNGHWRLDAQALYSDSDDHGTGAGLLGEVRYAPRQGFTHRLQFTYFDDEIDINDLGFQQRNDIKGARYEVEWIKSGLKRIRNYSFAPYIRYEENSEGFRTNNAIAANTSATLNNLAEIEAFTAYVPERYDDRNSFGNGTFRIEDRVVANISYRTNPSLPLSLFGKFGYRGEFIYGQTIEPEVGITWRPRHNLSFELKARYLDREGWLLHQEDQNFTTFDAEQVQPEFRAEFFPTSQQQLRLTLQWAGVRAQEDRFYFLPPDSTDLVEVPKPPGPSDSFSSSQLNFQVRYRWQIAPLSDLFIVYTKGDSTRTDLLEFDDMFQRSWNEPVGDQLVIKLRYRLGS